MTNLLFRNIFDVNVYMRRPKLIALKIKITIKHNFE